MRNETVKINRMAWAGLVAGVILAVIIALAGTAWPGGETFGNNEIQSFAKAKRLLLVKIYHDHRVSLYCGCEFGPNKRITRRNGYKPMRDNARAARIEWEHVVPAATFGRTFKAWRDGHPACVTKKGKPYKGRRCANKASREYRYMQADLYNLYPVVGELNGLRSDYPYTIIPLEKRRFGDCDFEIEKRRVEPAPHIRGDIARTYLYMMWAYPGRVALCPEAMRVIREWAEADPVDDWERTRARRIEAAQGNVNPFVR